MEILNSVTDSFGVSLLVQGDLSFAGYDSGLAFIGFNPDFSQWGSMFFDINGFNISTDVSPVDFGRADIVLRRNTGLGAGDLFTDAKIGVSDTVRGFSAQMSSTVIPTNIGREVSWNAYIYSDDVEHDVSLVALDLDRAFLAVATDYTNEFSTWNGVYIDGINQQVQLFLNTSSYSSGVNNGKTWTLDTDGYGAWINGSKLFSISNNGTISSNPLTGGGTLEADINGNIILGASDRSLKQNIAPLSNNLDKVLQLQPVSYIWKDTSRFGNRESIGFIAQDLETVLPQVVSQGNEYKSVNYQLITAVLAGAIQELNLKLENIQSASSTVVVSSGFSLNSIRDWLGNVGNGITNLFTKRLTTEEICIVDDQGQTCFNRTQINNILGETGNNYNGPDSSNNQDSANNQSQDGEDVFEEGIENGGEESNDETSVLDDVSGEENSSQDGSNSSDNDELPEDSDDQSIQNYSPSEESNDAPESESPSEEAVE
jgi:hypothetical protein